MSKRKGEGGGRDLHPQKQITSRRQCYKNACSYTIVQNMKCVLMSVQTNATQPIQLQSNYPEVEIKNKTKNVTLDVTVTLVPHQR